MGEEEEWWKNLIKYFIHGIGFSILFLFLLIGWAFISVLLVGLGSIIGLIIGLGLLFLVIGYINGFLTDLLWFPVRAPFWGTLFHGFALFIALLIVEVILEIPNMFFSNTFTRIITFIAGVFLNGLVGKTVAGGWKEEAGASMETRMEVRMEEATLDIQRVYKKILFDYVTRYGSMTGKAILNDTIKDCLEKGLSFEDAVLTVAKAGGHLN